jgi:hypothetical protein
VRHPDDDITEDEWRARESADAYEPPDYVEISLLTGRRVRYVPGSEPSGGGYDQNWGGDGTS